jgi:hypothetical protein
MRAALLLSMALAITLGSHQAVAGSGSPQAALQGDEAPQPVARAPRLEQYRGYSFDLSESTDRKDVAAMTDNLKRQLDVVESSGLSPKVLRFFHSVPIVASEMACLEEGAAAACYGLSMPERERRAARDVTTWDHDTLQWTNSDRVDLAIDSGLGVIMLRPNMLRYTQEPVMLHEFLHAYHAKLMPNGFENRGIKDFYAQAKSKDMFPKDAYVVKNQKEFFAVTASIFLTGQDATHEPKTRAALREKMPDYYKYLVGVFGFDPDNNGVTPVASAESPVVAAELRPAR